MRKQSPLESIRRFCVDCQGGSFAAVIACRDLGCPFYDYRLGEALPRGQHAPLRACKRYCLEYCQAGAGIEEVRGCCGDEAVLGPCPVFPFRMGRNPNISEATREKQRLAASMRAVKGVFGFSKTTAHAPIDPLGSTETGAVTL